MTSMRSGMREDGEQPAMSGGRLDRGGEREIDRDRVCFWGMDCVKYVRIRPGCIHVTLGWSYRG